MLVLLTGLFSSGASADAFGVIDRIDISGLASISRDEFLYLLDLKSGAPLDALRLRAGIKRAYLKGIFEDIRIERQSSDLLHLSITVRERMKVRRIEFAGAGDISVSGLSDLLVLKKDDRYRPSLAEQSCERIEQELKRRGLKDAQVTFRADQTDGGIALYFLITEGRRDVIHALEIEDPADMLPSLKDIAPGEKYDAPAIEAIVEKTRISLAKRKHVNSSVTTIFSDGKLQIRVLPGETLDLVFVGNHALGDTALRKETTFFDVRAFNQNLVEESLVRIRNQYRQIGYPEMDIVPVLSRQDGSMTLTYYISEGKRQMVKDILFPDASVSRKTLLEQISFAPGTPYNADLIRANRESLLQFYQSSGYLTARIDEPLVQIDDEGVVITFPIAEGQITRVDSILITGNRTASHELLLSFVPMKPGDPYSDTALGTAKLKIGEWYQKSGYADVVVDVERKLTDNRATISISVKEGGISRFGKHVIVGNDSTKHVVLERELLHREGDPYNPSMFLDERVALNRTGLFSTIDIQTEPSDQGRRDVIYKVQEAPAGAVEFGFGYAEYERFRTFFDISHRNLWGMNRQVQFRIDFSSIFRRATVSYYQPWAFGERDLAFKALLIGETKKELNIDKHEVLYRSDRYGGSIGFEKKFSPQLRAELMYDLANVHTYEVQPGVVISREDTGTLLISGMHASITYDRRDNAVEPTKGYLLGATYKLTGPYFLSETNFSKLVFFANAYTSLNKNLAAAFSLRSGLAKGFGETKNLPIIERFFLGGRTSVRGYQQDLLGPKDAEENPTGGDAFLMGNAELRMKVWNNFGLVAFFDAGNVWTNLSELTVADLRYTAGLGLRYQTPVGPLRVDYGRKLNREGGESAGAIHFSIGHAF